MLLLPLQVNRSGQSSAKDTITTLHTGYEYGNEEYLPGRSGAFACNFSTARNGTYQRILELNEADKLIGQAHREKRGSIAT